MKIITDNLKIPKRFILPLSSMALIVLSLIIVLVSFRFSRNINKKAVDGSPEAQVQPILSDKVFGKPDANETAPNQIVGNRVFHPQGIVIDRNTSPNRVYIFDSGNSRILGFSALGTCVDFPNIPCTTKNDCSSGECSINSTREADIVIGQVDKFHGSCNGDNSSWKPASASTLCSQPYPETKTVMESPDGTVMAVDDNHNLYIHDKYNNRILKYNDPFATDNIADFVWGQSDFVKRGRNFSMAGDIDNRNFYYFDDPNSNNISGWGINWGTVGGDYLTGGVDVDPWGNVWVADSGNHRVLRFPPNEKKANLVLGQSDFSSRSNNAAISWDQAQRKVIPPRNYLYNPKVVKYNRSTNQIFVIDWPCNTCLSRILIYNAPFTNSMEPTEVLLGDQNQMISQNAQNYYDFRFHRISGLEFDPQNPNAFWLSNANRLNYFEKINGNWTATKVLGQKSIDEFTGEVSCRTNSTDGDHSSCRIRSTNGGIGIDSAGNIYASDLPSQEVKIFTGPIPDAETLSGQAYPGGFFLKSQGGDNNANLVGGYSFRDPSAMILISYPSGQNNSQLLVADQGRVLFWNDYLNKSSGSKADGVLFANSFEDISSSNRKEIMQMQQDSQGRIWMAGEGVFMFQGPVVNKQPPVSVIPRGASLQTRIDNQIFTINLGNLYSGLAYDEKNDVLWLADIKKYRIVRISHPLEPNERIVDMVIGQPDIDSILPNRSKDDFNLNPGQHNPPWASKFACPNISADSFGTILGKLKLDSKGNLYVGDATFEGWLCSNNRLLEFDALDLLPTENKVFFAEGEKKAKRVYGASDFTRKNYFGGENIPKSPMSVSFINNKMLMSVDGYGNPSYKRIFVFDDYLPALEQTSPRGYVQPWGAMPVGGAQLSDISFDNFGNMAILDHTWNRVLYFDNVLYNKPEILDCGQKPTIFPVEKYLLRVKPRVGCRGQNQAVDPAKKVRLYYVYHLTGDPETRLGHPTIVPEYSFAINPDVYNIDLPINTDFFYYGLETEECAVLNSNKLSRSCQRNWMLEPAYSPDFSPFSCIEDTESPAESPRMKCFIPGNTPAFNALVNANFQNQSEFRNFCVSVTPTPPIPTPTPPVATPTTDLSTGCNVRNLRCDCDTGSKAILRWDLTDRVASNSAITIQEISSPYWRRFDEIARPANYYSAPIFSCTKKYNVSCSNVIIPWSETNADASEGVSCSCQNFCAGHIVDMDFDGYPPSFDCNDNNPDVHPNAYDRPNDGIDWNCDGLDNPAPNRDADNDGWPEKFDCIDNNPDIHPGAYDRPNDGIDWDCDGRDSPVETNIPTPSPTTVPITRSVSIRNLAFGDCPRGQHIDPSKSVVLRYRFGGDKSGWENIRTFNASDLWEDKEYTDLRTASSNNLIVDFAIFYGDKTFGVIKDKPIFHYPSWCRTETQ